MAVYIFCRERFGLMPDRSIAPSFFVALRWHRSAIDQAAEEASQGRALRPSMQDMIQHSCHPAERSGASSRCCIHSDTQRRTVNGWRSDQRAGIQNQLNGSVDTSASQMDAGRRMWCCCSCCHSQLHPAGRRRKKSWLWFLTWQIPILSKDSLDG